MRGLGLQPIVQQVFAHDEGQTPRPLQTPAAEDALGAGHGAHATSPHVLDGTPIIRDKDDLALRAIGHTPAAHSPAGAFLTQAGALAGMQTALTNHLAVAAHDWNWLRGRITRGNAPQFTVGGVNPAGSRMDANAFPGHNGLPPYGYSHLAPYHGGFGTSPLRTGENFDARAQAAGKWGWYAGAQYLYGWNNTWVNPPVYVPRAGFVAGPDLATENPNPASVTLRIIGENVTGGFFVHSAWPE